MENADLGFSGFVGSTLLKQVHFLRFSVRQISTKIENREFDGGVCGLHQRKSGLPIVTRQMIEKD